MTHREPVDELSLSLLAAGRDDAPRAGSTDVLLAALLAASAAEVAAAAMALAPLTSGAATSGAAAAASAVGAGAKVSAATGTPLLLSMGKWLVLGSLTFGGGVWASRAISPAQAPSAANAPTRTLAHLPAPAASTMTTSAASAVLPPPESAPDTVEVPAAKASGSIRRSPVKLKVPGAETEAESAAIAEATPVAAAPSSAPRALSLSDEVTLLDGARSRVREGDGAGALRLLADLEQRRTGPSALAPELFLVRIEALLSLGDRATASQVFEALRRAHPKSAAARRANDLLASPATVAP